MTAVVVLMAGGLALFARAPVDGTFVVDEGTITNDGKPLLMFTDAPKVASAHS